MNGAIDISWLSLALSFILLLIPLAVTVFFKLGQLVSILISIARMAAQLFLIGFFLGYLFELDSIPLNILWFAVMVAVATGTVIRKSSLKIRTLMLPAFFSLLTAGFSVLLFFTGIILQLDGVFEAKYFIALGGMILGNSLRANIIGVTAFYSGIRRDENRYLYRLSAGASRFEALLPNLRNSLNQAFSPVIANMATMGIVFLPGMMTGQIIGGSDPLVAVKYQIAIMLAIFCAVTFSTVLCIGSTSFVSFTGTGMLKRSIFQKRK